MKRVICLMISIMLFMSLDIGKSCHIKENMKKHDYAAVKMRQRSGQFVDKPLIEIEFVFQDKYAFGMCGVRINEDFLQPQNELSKQSMFRNNRVDRTLFSLGQSQCLWNRLLKTCCSAIVSKVCIKQCLIYLKPFQTNHVSSCIPELTVERDLGHFLKFRCRVDYSFYTLENDNIIDLYSFNNCAIAWHSFFRN